MRVIVVEDEAVVARRLLRLLRKILGRELVSLAHHATLAAAAKHLNRHAIDVLFLDLNLSGRDGFELLADSVSRPFQTVVVSARHTEALRAFEYGVLDFVPKPYDEERLRAAVDRVRAVDAPVRERDQRTKYLAVRKRGEIVSIAISDVVFVKGADDFSELHCRDGSVHLHQKTLSALTRLLPPSFDRIHRSYIVDMEAVRSFRSEEGSRTFVRLASGEDLPVGRSRAKALRDRLL
ncbi:MAG: LytTR family DNA-binding domain-containing protein [Acidobacteriota bacterium]